jgi:hypothetical protein
MNAYPEPQCPIIIRYHRLLEAFSRSDDERDFYLDRIEGAILYLDLDKPEEEVKEAEKELSEHPNRYIPVPKLTYYESKKLMEGFVNEKVYDIDTKEKLLDIIGSAEARENFLEFVFDHLTELDKWQQFYLERFKIRIIEWLCKHRILFTFEEDLEIPKNLLEKAKLHLFDVKVPKDVAQAREIINIKATSYQSADSYVQKPRRGRPPKALPKVETEPQFTIDIFKTCPSAIRPFLYLSDYNPDAIYFSSKFQQSQEPNQSLRGLERPKVDTRLEMLSQRLESLRHLSGKLGTIPGLDQPQDRKIIETLKLTPTIIVPDENRMTKVFGGSMPEAPKKRGRPQKGETEPKKILEKKTIDKRIKSVSPIRLKKG